MRRKRMHGRKRIQRSPIKIFDFGLPGLLSDMVGGGGDKKKEMKNFPIHTHKGGTEEEGAEDESEKSVEVASEQETKNKADNTIKETWGGKTFGW